jgi:hypothetical protein
MGDNVSLKLLYSLGIDTPPWEAFGGTPFSLFNASFLIGMMRNMAISS